MISELDTNTLPQSKEIHKFFVKKEKRLTDIRRRFSNYLNDLKSEPYSN